MATVSERARELQEVIENISSRSWDSTIGGVIEQALLAERRLAKIEDAEIAKQFLDDEWVLTLKLSATTIPNKCAAKLRAAAEKEVGK